MATGTLKPKRQPRSRTLYAAGLLVGLIGVLLVAWFFSGWADVRAQQRELRTEPARAADLQAAALSAELRVELSRLVSRETERPYFHYQNLFHDPRTGNSVYVSPSPLSTGPQDPLVLGYFQLDNANRLTTPTINDDVPHLSEPTKLAENRQFRDEVARSFSAKLRLHGELVADASGSGSKRAPPQVPENEIQQQRPQTIQIDQQSYQQNSAPTEIYWSNYVGNDPRYSKSRINGIDTNEAAVAAVEGAMKPVTITISPLEWRTYPYAGAPALVAVRSVATPDGTLAQGFVVDRSSLTSWLANRAGESVAQLVDHEEGGHNEIAPGWQLTVAPNPRALLDAAITASQVATSFLIRFVIIGVIAAVAAMLVVMLVARAERLARERSQFAAAAAHELRTPLAGLQLYGDMLADGLGDPAKLRDYAKRMSEEASRLGRVVSNVLGFSQLERGNLSVEAKPGPLGEVLADLAERAEPALDRAGAMLALDVSPDLRASYDRDAVIRIVGNLLDNAEKYGRAADDRTIELAAKEVDGAVEITVSDHGPGVALAARAKLFQAFSRGVDADGPAGLGLGLALSQSLAHAMGGDLQYRAADHGATFVLRLARAES